MFTLYRSHRKCSLKMNKVNMFTKSEHTKIGQFYTQTWTMFTLFIFSEHFSLSLQPTKHLNNFSYKCHKYDHSTICQTDPIYTTDSTETENDGWISKQARDGWMVSKQLILSFNTHDFCYIQYSRWLRKTCAYRGLAACVVMVKTGPSQVS